MAARSQAPFTVSSVPVNVLAIAGLSSPCISRIFLQTNLRRTVFLPLVRPVCVQLHFRTLGEALMYLCHFAIVADVRADVVERVQLRVCLTSLFAYVVDFSFV